jgi:tetratricopeptide (TPR) repeat protein
MAENMLLKNGIAAYNDKRYRDALKYFKKYHDEAKGDKNQDYYFFAGLVFIRMGDLDGAIDNLRKLINAKLSHGAGLRLRMLLGYVYAMKENYKVAKEVFQSALKFQPEDVQVLSALGYIAYKAGNPKEAIRLLKKAVKADEQNPNAHNSLGYVYATTEDKFDAALKECEIALSLTPGYPAYLDSIGWTYFKMGNTALAKRFLTEALDKLPESDEIRDHFKEVVVKELNSKKHKDRID